MDGIDRDPHQIDLIDHIEDVEQLAPKIVDPDNSLTDVELEQGGLVAVKAFVRSKASKNALSVRKSAERREKGETGPPRRQLNLQAPVDDDAREALKQVNTALLNGKIDIADLLSLSGEIEGFDWRARALAAEQELEELRAKIKRRRWWRLW